jgi:hypothetical protein
MASGSIDFKCCVDPKVQLSKAATAAIYVYDNNSKESIAEEGAKAGAIVRTEALQGKGHLVRRMFY